MNVHVDLVAHDSSIDLPLHLKKWKKQQQK